MDSSPSASHTDFIRCSGGYIVALPYPSNLPVRPLALFKLRCGCPGAYELTEEGTVEARVCRFHAALGPSFASQGPGLLYTCSPGFQLDVARPLVSILRSAPGSLSNYGAHAKRLQPALPHLNLSNATLSPNLDSEYDGSYQISSTLADTPAHQLSNSARLLSSILETAKSVG